MQKNKERTRGVPRPGVLPRLAAALLLAAPVVEWAAGKMDGDYYSTSSLFLCLLAAAGGALLLTGRGRLANQGIGGALLLLAASVVLNEVPMLLALALWIVSVAGLSWNRAPGFLPPPLRLPLLNLLSAAAVLVTLLERLGYSYSQPVRLVVALLAAAGGILLNLAVEPQAYLPRTPEERALKRGVRCRSVPREGAAGLLGALLVLFAAVYQIVQLFRNMEHGFSVLNFLWPAVLLAAGVLLVLRTEREKRLLPASILLLVYEARNLLVMRQLALYGGAGSAAMQQIQMTALLFFSVLLLLVSAVGASWNVPVGKRRPVPALNAAAAALAAGNAVWTDCRLVSNLIQAVTETEARIGFGSVSQVLLNILLPAGLVLLNLSMEGREAPARGWKVDGGRYRRGLSGFLGGFYTDVGGKLQLLARISGFFCLLLGAVGAFLAGLGVLLLAAQLVGLAPPQISPMPLLAGGLGAVLGALVLAVGTWPLYAFGQITKDLHAIREGGAGITPAAPREERRPENPDQLPEL